MTEPTNPEVRILAEGELFPVPLRPIATYEVSVRNTFDDVSPEDAVRQMIEWLLDTAASTGYRVHNLDTGLVSFVDGDDL